MSQPQLFLGDTPIGAVNGMTTTEESPAFHVRFETQMFNLGIRVITTWWREGCPHVEHARTLVMTKDPADAWCRDYPLPVTVGGLDEAHHAVVAQVKGR